MPELSFEKSVSKTISKDNWKNIGFKKRAGVLIPLFTVYSKDSFGIGDFGDLKLIIDWAKLTSNSILQLLPMNEVGPLFCPYDGLSSFALEPAYICLKSFPGLIGKKFGHVSENCNYVDIFGGVQTPPFRAGKEYAALSINPEPFDSAQDGSPKSGELVEPQTPGFSPGCVEWIDYAVKEEKLRLLWDVYLACDLTEALDFEDFQRKNFYWLSDFALFKVLKKHHQGKPWYEWGEKFKQRSRQALQAFQQENIEEVTFQIWLQWILFKQFKEAIEYAAQNDILIKGDLPVLVSRDSADVWSHPQFFKLDFASGAPPDMYCAKGQRWGMPTYDWESIAEDDYRYIKEKLRYAEEFYNILRIDHVVGLFRIWSIPDNDSFENQGLNGKFFPPDEGLWRQHGQKILTVLVQNTKMLLCAEDLGVVPNCCTDTLLEFGICGTNVQRWVKDWDNRHDFLLPGEYRKLSVAALSTHDTANWKAWWQYEAGTVDQGLFMRKCDDHRINFAKVSLKLFDAKLSFYGRLRWKKEVDSIDKLSWELGKNKEEIRDFIDLYENTYGEKEKLWRILGCPGAMAEAASEELLAKVIQFILGSRAIFCINSIRDYLGLADIFKGDPCQYRINLPGTISPKNWSLRLPISLEELLAHPVNQRIRKMVVDSGRI